VCFVFQLFGCLRLFSPVFCFGCLLFLFPFLWGIVALFCSPVVVTGGFVSCVLVALCAIVGESDSKSAYLCGLLDRYTYFVTVLRGI